VYRADRAKIIALLLKEEGSAEKAIILREMRIRFEGKHDVLTWDVSQELGWQRKGETQAYMPLCEP
jgi:hypothetical protein